MESAVRALLSHADRPVHGDIGGRSLLSKNCTFVPFFHLTFYVTKKVVHFAVK